MLPVKTILMILALVAFAAAAANVNSRINLLGTGLALLTLAMLVTV